MPLGREAGAASAIDKLSLRSLTTALLRVPSRVFVDRLLFELSKKRPTATSLSAFCYKPFLPYWVGRKTVVSLVFAGIHPSAPLSNRTRYQAMVSVLPCNWTGPSSNVTTMPSVKTPVTLD